MQTLFVGVGWKVKWETTAEMFSLPTLLTSTKRHLISCKTNLTKKQLAFCYIKNLLSSWFTSTLITSRCIRLSKWNLKYKVSSQRHVMLSNGQSIKKVKKKYQKDGRDRCIRKGIIFAWWQEREKKKRIQSKRDRTQKDYEIREVWTYGSVNFFVNCLHIDHT